jgi:predicted TIM-barrel fold metal-dependent hydrolase
MHNIVDMHSHIGDILYPYGGELIYKKGISTKWAFDSQVIYERRLWRNLGILDVLLLIKPLFIRSGLLRNASGTLENMRASMDEAHIWKTVCLPVPPYVTFNDLKQAQVHDEAIIPFTGFDPSLDIDLSDALRRDVENGAKGMKLHPIIQNEPLNSEKTFGAVQAFAPHALPILFHCGVSAYYPKTDQYMNTPEYGAVHYARDLISTFPNVTFIVGHGGLFQWEEVIEQIASYENAYVEISFMSVEGVRRMLEAFQPERVLFGSDWPWGKRTTAIKVLKEVSRGDEALERMIFYDNAVRLLKLDD